MGCCAGYGTNRRRPRSGSWQRSSASSLRWQLRPAALVLEGEPGIGKTALWTAGREAADAAGHHVLVARADEAEAKLGYAALADLLSEAEEEMIRALPVPQRRALQAALLQVDPSGESPPDQRSVATAVLSLIETMAADRPVVLAVDDLQWVDASTARVIRFVARRLAGRVGILATVRSTAPAADGLALRNADQLVRLRLEPLDGPAVHSLLRQRLGRGFPQPALRRIESVAAGNPFLALEVARSLDEHGATSPERLPQNLREIVDARLKGLDAEVRDVLLVAAALTQARVGVIRRAAQGQAPGTDVVELLGQAEAAGVVRIQRGRVRFTHPLLASGVYAAATEPQRRDVHQRLSQVVDGVEERARHLALACVEASPETMAALEQAATAASARGAPADAAELLELALGLDDEDASLLIRAAEHHLHAGDFAKSKRLLERAVSELPPGPERARGLGLLGTIHHRDDSYVTAATLLGQALDETADREPRVMLGVELAYVLTNAGLVWEAEPRAATAVDEAEQHGDDGLVAIALGALTMIRFIIGRGLDEAALARAVELEDPQRPVPAVLSPTVTSGLLLLWTGRLDQAEAALERARRRCLERGEESEVVFMTPYTALIACGQGDSERAWALADDAGERAWQLGSDGARAIALSHRATVAAWTGNVEEARRCGEESLDLFERMGSPGERFMPDRALGLLELSLGHNQAAVDRLTPAGTWVLETGVGEPAVAPFVPDLVEALVGLDRIADALPFVLWLEDRARVLDRPQLVAVADRCRGLVLGAEGRLEEAEEALDRALAADDGLSVPFERARSLLVLGQIQRRRRARRAARQTLESARAAFGRLDAPLWAERAEAEIARLGPPGATGGALTPSEQRIAELSATGLTNREVAAELFISPKTVEANLSRIYGKLGIHSRAELGGRLARR